jgi:hypothetical protein
VSLKKKISYFKMSCIKKLCTGRFDFFNLPQLCLNKIFHASKLSIQSRTNRSEKKKSMNAIEPNSSDGKIAEEFGFFYKGTAFE